MRTRPTLRSLFTCVGMGCNRITLWNYRRGPLSVPFCRRCYRKEYPS